MTDNFAAIAALMRELNGVDPDVRLRLLISVMTDAEIMTITERMKRMFRQ